MSEPETASGAGVLVLRLAAALFLTAAGLFALVAFGITRLESRTIDGVVGYTLPGGSRSLDPMIVTLLSICACVTGVLGAVVWILGHGRPGAFRLAPRPGRRPYVVLGAGLLLLVAALLLRFGR